MRRALPIAGLIGLLAASAARAETGYSLTETLVLEWLWDNGNGALFDDAGNVRGISDDYYWDIKNRLNLGLQMPGLDVNLRVDTTTFRFNYPTWMGDETDAQRADREELWYRRYGVERDDEGEYGHVGDYRLERASAAVDINSDWRATFGDFYAHLGRGLVLSLRKLDEMGIDNALRGVRLDGRIVDRVDVTLLGGVTNVTNVDERYNLIVEDPLDLITGGRVAVDLWDSNRLALHSVYMRGHAPETLRDEGEREFESTVMYGGGLDFPDLPGGLRFYAEADGVHREVEGDESMDGWGLYSELSWAWDPIHLSLEYKDYEDFIFEGTEQDATNVNWQYNRPPMADSEDQVLESYTNVRGGRVKLDWQINDEASVYFAVAGADDLGETSKDAVHGYAGFEWFWGEGQSSLRGVFGYRHAWADNVVAWDPVTGEPSAYETVDYRTLIHGKLDLMLHVWGPLSLGLSALHEEWTRRDMVLGEMLRFRRGTSIASLDWSGVGGLWFSFEYDTESESEGYTNYFYAGGLQYFTTDWLTLRLRAGTQRGGEKCMGGVCRVFPPMSGMRLEAIVRF